MNAVLTLPGDVHPLLKRFRFTVEQYHRLAECGFIAPDAHVELLDGEIIEMSTIGSPHASTVDRVNTLFHERFGRRAVVRVQGPVEMDQHGEPQPDLALLKPTPDFYFNVAANTRDVLLLVEVADSTLEKDRSVKGPMYARANIKEYWLVNIPDRCVEVYRRPTLKGYRSKKILGLGETLTIQAFPGVELAVKDVFGA